MSNSFRKLSDLTLPFQVESGRTIVDGDGRFVCSIDRGSDDLEMDRLSPVAADKLTEIIADLLTEAVWSGIIPDFKKPHLKVVD
jgi:hypothetical protein